MRIKSISLHNYRQYKDVFLNFTNKQKNELYVFIGKNGTGKTNILNAINWCLYNEEPHLSQDSEGLPILNNLAYQNAEEDAPVKVQVEITIEMENGLPIVFSREETFKIKNNKEISKSQKFKVIKKDEKLNDIILENDKARECVERVVPKNIREYFFFDGERLDNYFKIPGEVIKPAIIDISKINYLFRMNERIENISRGYKREAGKVSDKIHELQEDLEKKTEELKKFNYQLGEANSQFDIGKKEIQRISEELARFPNISALEVNKIKLEKQIEDNAVLLEDRKKKKANDLYKQYILVNSYEATNSTLQIIQEMRKKGEIPPFTDKEKLVSILDENFCNICGRSLDPPSKKWVEEIIKKIPISSKTAIELSDLENPIKRMFTDIEENLDSILDISKEIVHYEDIIRDLDGELNQIRSKLEHFDIDKIRNLERERKSFEESRDTQKERSGHLKELISRIQNEIGSLNDQIEKEGKRNERAKIFMQKVVFCNEAKNVLELTIKQRLDEIRNKIQEEANEIFFGLIWKRSTFNHMTIDDDYQVKITSSDTNLPMLGCLSKAENELLALSFTLALHKVSGFDAPLLIDTPVARVSDDQRVNFGKTLAQISYDKQIFLLFTPAEYSPDIQAVIEPELSTKYLFEMSSDEKETMIKEIQ
jgi:DNA sulfur modification protein DndD